MTTPTERKPDISLYYSITPRLVPTGTNIYGFTILSDDNLIGTKQYNLCADFECQQTIGAINYAGSATLINNISNTSEIVTIFLPEGCIYFFLGLSNDVNKNVKEFATGLIKKPTTLHYRIGGGSGSFAFVEGFITINYLAGGERIIYIYFKQ